MGAIKKGREGYVGGSVLAAMAVLLIPAAAAAADSPTIRVTRPGVGRIVLDVADATVAVRKEVTADRSVVTLTTPEERLNITVRRGVVLVAGPRGSMVVDTGAGAATDRLLVALQRSDAASRALRLLERVSEGPETFAGQSLLMTRALLETGTGANKAMDQHQAWVSERAAALAARPGPVPGKPTLIRAAWLEPAQKTPGECWDIYSKEAIRIAKDFDDCTEDLKWWEAHLWTGCTLIYVVRAEAAMAWFISCNGGVPFSG